MKTVRFVVPLLGTTFGFAVCASAEIYYPWCANYGGAAVAAPIAAGPPMSNAWSRSGAWAASAIQIRFTRSDTEALEARRREDAQCVEADLVPVNSQGVIVV